MFQNFEIICKKNYILMYIEEVKKNSGKCGINENKS